VSERVSYPIELNLADREVVVIGGGPVAARKIEGLVQAGARVRAVSPSFVPELLQRTDIHRQTDSYTLRAIGSAKLVFACTDDRDTNARIAADAQAAGCWCNVADDPEAGDFFVPAVLRRGQFTVAVGTGGAGPKLASLLRDRLESQFGPEFGILVEELQRARRIARDQIGDPQVRRRLFATLCSQESVEVLRSAGVPGWREWFEKQTCQIAR
jgi:precorrin-2 dehydrogenase / sirohydrochlorin ferrochelatase